MDGDSAGEAITAAFAYAWWLTGDEQRAEQALWTALAEPPSRDAAEGASEEAPLLAAVRRAAIEAPTMCPASELALLHDIHGLSLVEAADLVAIDPRDAGTELAHGRLEALPETVEGTRVHPERLGGLAVGSPADVAHARQCDDCGEVAALLSHGRAAMSELAGAAAPGPPAGLATAGGTPSAAPRRWLRIAVAAALALAAAVAVVVTLAVG